MEVVGAIVEGKLVGVLVEEAAVVGVKVCGVRVPLVADNVEVDALGEEVVGVDDEAVVGAIVDGELVGVLVEGVVGVMVDGDSVGFLVEGLFVEGGWVVLSFMHDPLIWPPYAAWQHPSCVV
jgi:hypothetical protein